VGAANFDIELQLLIDAIFLKYHYDFREYALASLKRRLRAAMARLGCRTLSQLQDRVLHEPATFPILLDFLTVPVSEMFRDPAYFRSLRSAVVPVLRTYPFARIWVITASPSRLDGTVDTGRASATSWVVARWLAGEISAGRRVAG